MATNLMHTLVSATTALTSVSCPHLVLAQEARYSFELPEQDLASALRAYAKVTGQQVAFDGEHVRGRRSTPVIGSYSADGALSLLLRDTGLTVRQASQGVLIIEDANRTASLNQAELSTRSDALDDAKKKKAQEAPDTIVVTGSHIRGVDTTVGSQVISIGREDIKSAGHATVRDVFEALPQNFGGGATGELSMDAGSRSDQTYGTTINLRGLGSVATLVLINGRRLPATGASNNITDVSIIPVTAINRIEILPDGASAVYGSDAVAGVVNFILRKDFEGLETTARYGAAVPGRFEEYQFSAAAGHKWQSGNVFLAYEFTHRDRIRATDREFSRSSDFRAKGGGDRRSIYANPGNIINPSTSEVLFAIPPGQNGQNLTADQLLPPSQANRYERAEAIDLLPRQKLHSVYGTAFQDISENLEFFAEGRFSKRKFNNRQLPSSVVLRVTPENPFYVDAFGNNQPIHVAYSFHRDGPTDIRTGTVRNYAATAGFNLSHGDDWQTEAWASYVKEKSNRAYDGAVHYGEVVAALNETDPAKAFNPLGEGSNTHPDVIARIYTNSADTRIEGAVRQANIVTTGSLLKINDEDVRFAAGLDGRIEKFSSTLIVRQKRDSDLSVKRRVGALFGELFVPVITESNNITGLNKLVISASIRHERYKDKSMRPVRQNRDSLQSTDPRVGILWSIVDGFNVRASYGTSFRAPGLHLLTRQNSVGTVSLPDLTSPSGTTFAMVVGGATDDITNETSDTFTTGVELQPTSNTNLKLNYFKIEFKNQVNEVNIPTALTDPSYAVLVTRNPDLQQLTEACSLADPNMLLTTPTNCTTPGIVQAIIDARARNFNSTIAEGFDFSASQRISAGQAGNLILSLNGTYIANYKNAISPRGQLISRLNTPSNPVDLRFRGSIAWMPSDSTTISTYINYTDNYRDPAADRKIASNTTVDLTATHNFGRERGYILRDLAVTFAVTNLFNDSPPFYENAATALGYDPANADASGRVVAVSLSKRW